MFRVSISFSLILLLALCSCKQEDPRTWDYEYISYQEEAYSALHFPVKLSVRAIEDIINEKLAGELLKNARINTPQLESDSISLVKNGRASFQFKGDECLIKMPVNFHLRGRFKVKIFKKQLEQEASFNLGAMVTIRSKVWVDSEYHFSTQSELVSIKWTEEPTLDVGSIHVSVAGILDKRLPEFIPQLVDKLDHEVVPGIKIRPSIEKVWEKIQEEKTIKTEYGNIYFQILPYSIGLSAINGKSQWLELYLSCWTDMAFDLKPQNRALRALPPLKSLRKVRKEFDIDLLLHLSYAEMNKKANSILSKEVFEIEGEEVRIKEVELFGAGQDIGLFAEITGDYSGKFFFKGRLNYDEKEKLASFDNLDLMMNDESITITMGAMLFQDSLMSLLEENMQFRLDTVLKKLPQILESAIGKKDNYERIQLKMDSLEITPHGVHVTKEGLLLPVGAVGRAELFIKDLSKKKKES